MFSFKNNDPIVVSGLSGKHSNADDLHEFREQLYNKQDMVTKITRFPRTPGLPERIGAIPTIEKFDNAYFGVPDKQVDYMNPSQRMIYETVCEAILDAGLNMERIKGTRTGIYVGDIFSDSEVIFFHEIPNESNAFLGSYKATTPLRLAYFLQVAGPTYICDSACSSAFYALNHAIDDLEHGKIDYAIVCGISLILAPNLTKNFFPIGVMSYDGVCKSFDQSANGYARSDANNCVILQKASTAKRIYAEIVHSRLNCDGFKEMGIMFPSGKAQKQLLDEFYDECKVPFEEIGFAEAHGTGTKAGDPVELNIIEQVYCATRKDPLLIGSVKSNVGHSEGACGLTGLAKCCMIYETGIIPPNIHYKNPNEASNGLIQGKMIVVTEKTPFPERKPYISISNFGFGGANAHILLKRPTIRRPVIDAELPRLLCVSGRTSEAVETYFNDVESRPYDPDFLALLNASFNDNIQHFDYRGYAIVNKSGVHKLTINNTMGHHQLPLKCVFRDSGIANIASTLLKFVSFQDHLTQVQNILTNNHIVFDWSSLINGKCDPLDSFATVVVQTGIVNILKVLQIEIAEFIGSGIGELSASYADDVIQLDQAILDAYRIRTLLLEHKEDAENGNMGPLLIANENVLIIGGVAANTSSIVSLCDTNDAENAFLHSLGSLFLLGYAMNINALYSVSWPVRLGTPMISHLVKWKHHKTWSHLKTKRIQHDITLYSIKLEDDWEYIKGHNVDGRILFPGTGYIFLAWDAYSNQEKSVIFENVKFLRACPMSNKTELQMYVQVCSKTGHFQIIEGGALIVTGQIKVDADFESEWADLEPLPMPKPKDMLNKRDVYKELRLRGYYYSGDFKEIQCCDTDATVANVKWTAWTSFMDTMLQIKMLSMDTRSLFVPTKIAKLMIHPKKHLDIVNSSSDSNNCIMPIHHYKDLDIIRCGFIEIRGVGASSIVRRKQPKPVLETNRFVPYVGNLDLNVAARVLAQITLENGSNVKVKVMEWFKDVPDTMEPLLPFIQEALNDQPLIQPELLIISDKKFDLPNITVSDISPSSETGNLIAVGCNLSENATLRETLLATLKPGGFLISRENLNVSKCVPDLTVICEYTTPFEKVIMLRVTVNVNVSVPNAIHVGDHDFKWLAPLREARQTKENVLLYSEKGPNNGLLGLTNCLLRESAGEKVVNVWIDDESAPDFDVSHEMYKKQLEKNMAINVYQNGVWGTYRHLLLNDIYTVKTMHRYLHMPVRGDLSSLCWVQGNLSIPENLKIDLPGYSRVYVYATGLNFRDVMLATGKLNQEVVVKDRKNNGCYLGMEFAGRKDNGERVIGHCEFGAFSNVIQVRDEIVLTMPNEWTMAEAATIPIVYATNILGLFLRAHLMEGESILIHSATGGIGLSAINIALYFKCKIFLTVGTQEKRDFILKHYPQIPTIHIGNSRDTSFYEMVLKQTDGNGVDLILNSLADEKLQASVRCLGLGGRFVEIGKFDLASDSPLSIELAAKEGEYHGVMLDLIIHDHHVKTLKEIAAAFHDGINKGYIKPLPMTCFNEDETEAAFRYMMTGKHVGKIVINLREDESEESVIPSALQCEAVPRFYCNPEGCYIISGGLGGFGLELADWLALRGARNIVLVSRKGLTTGFQQLRLKIWKSYNCRIAISKHDTSTIPGCEALLNMAQEMGDIVGIFNLAVVIRDALFENQTEETFLESYNPKGQATIFLDNLSRKMAPKLQQFVVFSSVSCGRGNAGQTNYGYSNSVMERICENRRKEGFPAKAIQWGVIGDVGIVADLKEENIEVVIGGTMQQRLQNCLEVLDVFLLNDEVIVSSMVVAEKKSSNAENDMISVVLELLHIKDIKKISLMTTFPELGMDSMMGVEIKQTLEREYDVFLSPQELRAMNFARLIEIANGEGGSEQTEIAPMVLNTQNLMRFIPSEDECDIPVVTMQTKSSDSPQCIYLLPGIEGMSSVFEQMVQNISVNAKCCQFCFSATEDTVKAMALQKVKILEKELQPNEPFTIIAHSIGTTVALEVVTMLEQKGYNGSLILIDGSPLFNRNLISAMFPATMGPHFEIVLISNIVSFVLPLSGVENLEDIMITLVDAKSFEERCTIVLDACPEKLTYSDEFLHKMLVAMHRRIKAEMMHTFVPRTYKSRIVLCKASLSALPDIADDYGLRELLNSEVEIQQFEGDHVSMMHTDAFIKFVETILVKL